MHKIAIGVIVMINISGNALDDWYEQGVERNDSLLTVNCCGYQKLITIDLNRKREQGRVDYQLIYLVGGKGTFYFNHQSQEVHKGQIVLYAPNEPQTYTYFAKDATEAYWIHFTGHGVQDYLQQCGLLDASIQTVGLVDEVGELFKRIIRELNMKKPFNEHVTTAYLLTLLALLGRRLQRTENQGKDDHHSDIHMIMEIMHENYSQHLVVSELAKKCNLSLFRFIHKFKDVTGTTPGKYVTNIRINEAKKMLAETSLHVKEVASIVGYDNPLYFSRVFCQAVGIPPSRYKDQVEL
jgi:AraC family transcriptional regulator of arabinose operon